MNAVYTWQQTLGLAVGYSRLSSNQMFGDSDFQGILTQLSYTPFGKQHSLASPWLNLRLDLSYFADVSSRDVSGSAGNGGYYFRPRTETLWLHGSLAF